MAEIGVREATRGPVFVVKFAVVSGPQPEDHFPEGRASGSPSGTPRARSAARGKKVGEYDYGQLDGSVDYYECPIEPLQANLAALAATGFAWSADAAELAARHDIDPAMVVRICAEVEAAHRECVHKLRWCKERILVGDNSDEVRKALRDAMEGLAG